jgi:hypothetical protein
MNAAPLAWQDSDKLFTVPGLSVLISINNLSLTLVDSSPFLPSNTSKAAVSSLSIEIMVSEWLATSEGLEETTAPANFRLFVFSGLLFHTVTGNPESSSRMAIGAPIFPRPRNPIFTFYIHNCTIRKYSGQYRPRGIHVARIIVMTCLKEQKQ